MSRSKVEIPERLDRRVDRTGACWLWTGALTWNGYGCVTVGSRTDGTRRCGGIAHRVFYELLVGEIPEGLVIDHLCGVRHCVNPMHMQVVTQRENTLRSDTALAAIRARQTNCKRGHEFTPENTRLQRAQGRLPFRVCRACEEYRARPSDRLSVPVSTKHA